MRLTDRFYDYFWQGYGNNCNSYIYRGKQLVLIDPGHIVNESGERCLETLTRSISADGIKLEDRGNSMRMGIPIMLKQWGDPGTKRGQGRHPPPGRFLEALEQRARAAGMEKMPPLAPDFYLQAGELNLGPPEAVETWSGLYDPGHSPGSICFYFPREKAWLPAIQSSKAVSAALIFPGKFRRLLQRRRPGPDDEVELFTRPMGPVGEQKAFAAILI